MAYCKHCGAQIQDRAVMCPTCGQRQVGGSGGSGKTIGIVAVVAGCGCLGIIGLGIVSAILVPNLMDALQKAKQKRTMADVRLAGTALMSWLVDHTDEPQWTLPERPSAEELSGILVPEYIAELPATDGWQHPLEYRVSSNLLGSEVFRIRSPGRDGVFDSDEYEYQAAPFVTTDYDRDIVWADGYFVRYPGSYSGR